MTTPPNKRVSISRNQSRRPTIAMDYYFMKMHSVVNAKTISGDAVTCIVVEEDSHQNIMGSVVLKQGVEEPWTIERVVRFVGLLGCREITLQSDTKLAIIAFRRSRSHNRGCSSRTK